MVAIMNINGFMFMFPLGVQFAASGLVGNMLGKGNSAQAKRFAIVCVLGTLAMVSTVVLLLNIFQSEIAGLFSRDIQTAALIVEVIPVLSIFMLLDAVHGV